MYSIAKHIKKLERKLQVIGEDEFGKSFEGAYFIPVTKEGSAALEVYIDCGHEFESDIEYYNLSGDEIRGE